MSETPYPPHHSGEALSIMKVHPILDTEVVVASTAQRPDGRLDDRHSAYYDNVSPPLSWTAVPDAKAWAVIVEDPDARQARPFVHWMIWNIPGEATGLLEGLPAEPLITPQGAIQGRNSKNGYGYYGPGPPPGHGLHHYYFQVFALDNTLDMNSETSLDELLSALKGRTLASGGMVATYEGPVRQ
ncbi:YbhB/YbcL family Raf kinase inhibitor-like protein [Phenylobacterium sp.]|jgi:hypothetical protein|uniref:YbhB/YbcL family Raf kinase inhibitor-like protein n=1 Tax=Phenylobacterium sp. TaxID=1871053 RepID=UPI002E308E93|nr:YbhB/YbcL family Raf kinase inhibitor-like protein [Phenylobacterium sp.]HEX4711433.1 YbhB/YbcL family Raf kinase inhibitor-like protein [Phenylobacterium sp.]